MAQASRSLSATAGLLVCWCVEYRSDNSKFRRSPAADRWPGTGRQ